MKIKKKITTKQNSSRFLPKNSLAISRKGFVTKYGFLLSYTIFFIFLQIILVDMAINILNSPFGALAVPSCGLGLFILDGLLLCGFNMIILVFTLFTVSSSFAVVQTIFIIPFIMLLVVIIADWLRGNA